MHLVRGTWTPIHPTQVRDALGHKVSRERVGAELDGMLRGPDPVASVQLLHRLRLFEDVFMLPDSVPASTLPLLSAAGSALLGSAHATLRSWAPKEGLGPEELRLTLLAAALMPLRGMALRTAKGKDISLASHVMRESLKYRAKDADAVDALHASAPRLAAVHRQLQAGSQEGAHSEAAQVALGQCIRRLKHLWRAGCVLAALMPLPEAAPLDADPTDADGAASGSPASTSAGAGAGEVGVCRELEAAAAAFGVSDCWSWKPVLDGKRVMAAAGMTQGGPALGKLMDEVVAWQLAHPAGTAEECLAWLGQRREGGA